MNFNFACKTAIIGILLNIILSYLVPEIIRGTNHTKQSHKCDFFCEISDMFSHHKRVLFSSSAVVATAIFLSVVIAQYI